MKAIDVHCHLAGFNPNIKSFSDLKFSLIQKPTIKVIYKPLRIKYMDNPSDFAKVSNTQLQKLIEDSPINHFVILGLDGFYDDNGNMINNKSLVYVDNSAVYDFSKKSKKILSGPSINPRRKDAFTELERAYKNNAALIKLHPCYQHFDPNNIKFKKFYKKAAQYKIPFLVHIGPETALPGVKLNMKYSSLEKVELMLKQGCVVIMAHGGGYSLTREKKRFERVLYYLKKFKNLYIDTSALSTLHRKMTMFSILKHPFAIERTVYGTDFPIYISALPFVRKLGVKKTKELQKLKNPFERDLRIKKALGFPNNSFSRGYKIINQKSL